MATATRTPASTRPVSTVTTSHDTARRQQDRPPGGKRGWGAMHLTTIGRRSGRERSVILGYLEDGPNLTVLAMNGWDEGHPAWWLNLEATPDAIVRLAGQQPRPMHARVASGQERDRLWKCWAAVDADLDAHASRRAVQTPVIVFEPRDTTTDGPVRG